MAALTKITLTNPRAHLCETIAITNQTAASTAVTKAVPVPPWAQYCTFVIGGLTLGGTTPSFDFILYAVDIAGGGMTTPDDGDLVALGGWDGITQKTAASATYTTIDIGPNIGTDDTGSATASDRYGIAAALPPWIAYKYTTTDANDDADYAATISVYFR